MLPANIKSHMRLLLFAICTLITCTFCNSTDGANKHDLADNALTDSCDTVFAQQLQQVIDLIPTGFASLRGKELVLDHGETAYTSTITIKETTHNKIGDISGRPYYMAKVAEKVTEEEAKRIVKLWKTKVATCLKTPAPQLIPYRTGGGKSELRDGTLFLLNEQHGVSVYWTNDVDTEIYDVVIAVI